MDVIHHFDQDNTIGARPASSLSQSPDGIIYGATQQANNGLYQYNGNIFEFDPVSEAISNSYSFDGKNGKAPKSGLTVISSGVFLGNTYEGGASGLVLWNYLQWRA